MPQEDFVPEQQEDWTMRDEGSTSTEAPFGQDLELNLDTTTVDINFLDDVSIETIEKQSFRTLPPGKHVVVIKDIRPADGGSAKAVAAFVRKADGTTENDYYYARKFMVIFAPPNDLNCTVQDWFIMPPANPAERHVFETGFTKEEDAKLDKATAKGFNARKLKYFWAMLGFEFVDNKPPAECGTLKNWVYYPGTTYKRLLEITVDPPKPRLDGKKSYPSVAMFSYKKVDPPPVIKQSIAQAKGAPEAAKQPAKAGGKKK